MHPSLSRRRFLSLSGAAAAAGLFARFGANACPVLDAIDPMADAKEIAKSINAFAIDLHTRLARDERDGLFFSPFSIEAALAMTAAGARGETLAEMRKTLHLPEEPHAAFGALIDHLNGPVYIKPDPARSGQGSRPIVPVKRAYELTVANAIWAQTGFPWHKEFAELTRKNYGAGLVEVNFEESEAARKRINDWVEKETKEKIKNLIGPGVITSLTRMVLANAIYFKGTWLYQFDKKYTKDAPFTRADGTKADVPLMSRTGEYGYGEFNMFVKRAGEKVQVLELPYTGKELSMLVYLPENPGGVNRLPQWLRGDELIAPKLTKQQVKVYLPRFKAETSYSLKPVLMDLGINQAFGGADFTGMSPEGKRLYISHVLHKAFVDVNEEGTEAAAATAVALKERAAPRETVFRADRPFVYVIRDNTTGTALFMGRYSGPAK